MQRGCKMFKNKAILIIHGFAGGTYDEEYLANYLELNKRFDVFIFTLPGHDVKDKRKATCEEWMKESENQLKRLIKKKYKNIYLIGHSMGGVIAAHLAKKYSEVKRVVLVAPAFTSLASKEEGGVLSVITKIPDIIKAYSYNELVTRVSKLPLRSEKEFFKLIETYRDDINSIQIPVMFVHGTIDQLVPYKSSEKIYNELNIDKKVFLTINDYYHDVFKGNKVEDICYHIERFLKNNNFKIISIKFFALIYRILDILFFHFY